MTNFLLLQIRNDPHVRAEEIESFALHAGIEPKQISVLNVFDQPQFDPAQVLNYDGLFIGGASEASVLRPNEFPFLKPCIELVHLCVDKKIPVFASCFGFQLAVMAFGGEIIRDEIDFEMGTYPLLLTELAKTDPLLSGMGESIPVISVHQESAYRLPDNCELLGRTKNCLHAFRVVDRPFWAFQFHPELNRACLIERLGIYKDQYTEGEEHYQQLVNQFEETPQSNQLLKKFVALID